MTRGGLSRYCGFLDDSRGLLAGRYSNKEIARSLYLAEGTAKNHGSEILSKLGTRDRTRAVLETITLRIVREPLLPARTPPASMGLHPD